MFDWYFGWTADEYIVKSSPANSFSTAKELLMKIFLLVLIGVLCASSRESRPNTNQSSLTKTSDASTSQKVSITFIATVKSIELLGERELKVTPVDFDSRFAVTVHIESVTPKEVPLKADTDENFAIHSPAQLFQVAKDDSVGKKYRFKVVWTGMPDNAKFDNLSAVSIVNEAT
jgi:hypothetical protein